MRIDLVRHSHADHFGAVLAITQNAIGYDACLDDFLVMINIMQKHIECAHALHGAFGQVCPLTGRNHAWNHVKRNQPFGAIFFAIDVKCNAHAAKQYFSFGTLGCQLLCGYIA